MHQIFNKKGFTLIETLVAVAILMISIASAFGLAPEGLGGARFARNQTVATYLAQEGLEVVHNMRDNAMLFAANASDPLNWLVNIKQCLNKNCTINPVLEALDVCAGSCPPLKVIESVDGSLTYGNGELFDSSSAQDAIFTRSVTVSKVPNNKIGRDDTEAKVVVTVTWKEGLITKTTRIEENLFDWWTYSK